MNESHDTEILNLNKLNNVKVTDDHEPDTFNRFAASSSHVSKAWENIAENIKITVKQWEQHKPWFMK